MVALGDIYIRLVYISVEKALRVQSAGTSLRVQSAKFPWVARVLVAIVRAQKTHAGGPETVR